MFIPGMGGLTGSLPMKKQGFLGGMANRVKQNVKSPDFYTNLSQRISNMRVGGNRPQPIQAPAPIPMNRERLQMPVKPMGRRVFDWM